MAIRFLPILRGLAMLIGIIILFTLQSGEVVAYAAGYDAGATATLKFNVHLRTRPFWLDHERPHSRYFATLDACVDPTFATVKSNASTYDFGNCFVLQEAKPGYEPINPSTDSTYLQSYPITYWTQTVQVVMPDQVAHTLDLNIRYVFHDLGQTGPEGNPVILTDDAVLHSQITVSASDGETVVPMDGAIPHEQYVHFLFHPVGAYNRSLSFWGCMRRSAPGLPSDYCGRMEPLPDGSFQLDAKVPTPPAPASLFNPTVDPVLEGTNIQLSIVAALPGLELPDAQPAPSGMAGHPANQIVTPVGSRLDCAMTSGLAYADQTLECSAAIKHDATGAAYLAPTKVDAYVGVPPSFAYQHCVVCTSTKPWPYAGPVLLALLVMVLGAAGAATLMYLGRVPLTPNRPLIRNPMFVGSAVFALASLVFLISGAVNFRIGYQPVVPGQVIFAKTPGAPPAENAVPPTPTFTPSPTPTSTSTPTPMPSRTPGTSPTPTP